MPDFAGIMTDAIYHRIVNEYCCADVRGHLHEQRVGRAVSEEPLGQQSAVSVVVNHGVNMEPVLENRSQGYVAPPQGRGVRHDAIAVHHSGNGSSYTHDRV